MSTAVFPSLPGITWPIKRTSQFKTNVVESTSGREVRIALRSRPRYLYEIPIEVLRSNATTVEFGTLMSFYNNRFGSFDTFLYTDVDDHAVATQAIAVGDGTTTAFQLVRSFGGIGNKSVDLILAPDTVSAVYLNGTLQTSGYTVSNWGTATPGVITFTSAPANTVIVTADFTWFWPCRFMEDTLEIIKNYQGFYSVDSLKFTTVF